MLGSPRNNLGVTPLILSFFRWEKERSNKRRSVEQRSLSHLERDRVRGAESGERL
jgi:hypothetical protein